MKHLSLFSGIGGFDLAAEWMGWENIAHCEWNPFGQRVLKYYWPNAISYHDITKTDFTIHRGTIDIVTGGFPCQPYSVAGKRKGKDDERHLWPEMLRAIREIQPRWVVGENVGGLLSWNGGLVFNEVQADLEAEGYEILPFLLPAAGVNAPHRRDRIWFVAYSNSFNGRWKSFRNEEQKRNTFRESIKNDVKHESSSNPSIEGREERICPGNRASSNTHNKGGSSGFGEVSKKNGEIPKRYNDAKPCNTGIARAVTDPNSRRQPSKEYREKESRRIAEKSFPGDWENFPTQSPVRMGNDGFSSQLDGITFSKWRNESIKAGGNAIVPQVALQIFKSIEQYENLNQ